MPDMNKVEVSFTADVTSFNRGVDRMERKIDEFDAKTEKELNNVNRRFDLLDGSVKKVEKSMNGFGDNVEMRGVQKQLIEVKDEFERTGKIGQGAINGLNSAIADVDFDSLDSKSKKAFKTVQKDATKLTDQVNKLKHIQFANNFEQENKVIAYSFSKLNESLNSTSLALNKVRKGMSPQQAQQYSKSMVNVRKTMSDFRSELNTTGAVSRDTFYRLKKDIETVNFNKLPVSARKAISEVSVAFTQLNRNIDISGTHIDRNHDKMRRFSMGIRNTLNTTKQDFSKFVVNINRIGTAFRNVGEVSAGAIRGGILASLTSVIPIAGTATTAIMGIGAGLGTVAGGAIGLGGAFGIAGGAVGAFVHQSAYALKMLEDGTLKVTNEVKNYQETLKGLKSDWEALINQNQAAIFNTMTNGIASARYALSTLNPFLADTAQKIAVASQKMHQWITTSDNAKNAFAMLNKIGPAIFQNILNSAGHVGNGVTRIFTAFGPLFTWTGQQLENLSKKFDIWANSSNTQRGIASFINYTKENLPVLSSVFNNTFLGIINLFKAFSGQTSWALKGLNNLTERFRNWAATLDQTQGFKDFIAYTRANAPVVGQFIGNLVNIMVAFVRAAAPIGEVVLKIVTAFTGWLANMMDSHPAIAKMIALMLTITGVFKMSAIAVGLLFVPFKRLITTLGLLIGKQRVEAIQQRLLNKSQIKSKGIIGALRGAYTGLITKIKALAIQERLAAIQTRIANGVKKAAIAISNSYRRTISRIANAQMIQAGKTKIAAAATAIWTGVTKGAALAARGLGLALRFMTGPVGWIITIIGLLTAAIIYLWKNNSGFRNAVIAIWNSIKAAAMQVFGFLKPYILNIWNAIKNGSIAAWNWIKSAAAAIWNGVRFAIQNPVQALQIVLGKIWSSIKWAAVAAWRGITGAISFIFNAWLSRVRQNLALLTGFFAGVWNGIKYGATVAWNAIKNAVLFIINLYISQMRARFNALKQFFTWLWQGIKTISVATWNFIKSAVLFIVVNFVKGIKMGFNGLRLFFTNLWSWLRNATVSSWNFIKNSVITIVHNLVNGIKYIINGLRTFFVTIWNYLKMISIAAWNAIKNGIISAIRNTSNTIRAIINALKTWLIQAWTFIKTRLIALALSIYNGIRSAFVKTSSAITSIIGRLRTWLINAWLFLKNKVVALARSLYSGVRSAFNSLLTSVVYIITKLRNWLVSAWSTIRSRIVSYARSLYSSVKSIFNSLWRFTNFIFSKIKSWLISTWYNIKNTVTSIVSRMWGGIRSTYNNLYNGTRNIFSKVKSYMVSIWNGIKSSVTGIVSKMWSSVSKTFWNMFNGLKNVVGKIKGVMSSMTSAVKSGLNKLIDGVNWVANKLGMEKLPKLSTGTTAANRGVVRNGKIAQDTFATVGDKGRGNGPGGFRHETITYPNGRQAITPATDTVTFLPKGSTVDSGRQTYQALSNTPHFASGTNPLGNGNKKPKKNKKGDNIFGDAWDATKAGAAKLVNKGKAVVSNTLDTAKKGVSKGANWLGQKVGEVTDYIDNPGGLLNKVFEGFGINLDAFGIKKSAELPYNMMKGIFKKLKDATLKLFTGWLEEQGGGDGGYIDLSKGINFGFARTAAEAAAMGYPFPRPHHGLDINYKYDKVYSTLAGKATGSTGWNGGFGRNMWIRTKNGIEAIYGHLSKLAFSGTKQVKPGDYLGVSGGDPSRDGVNAGSSTGPHLHYEMRWNGVPKDPTDWLRKNNGGGKKAPSAWRSTIIKAAKRMKVNPTKAQIDGIIAQIQRESGGDAGITQGNIGDINNLRGTPARGLLQYVPSTFDAYKVKGHGNITSGYDQLLAFFNNSNWAGDIQYGRSGWGPRGSRRFAAGTDNAPKGLSMLFEKGGEILNLNGGEQVIPNDVSIAAIERLIKSDIFTRTQAAVYSALERFANIFKNQQLQLDGGMLNVMSADLKWLANGGFGQSVAAYNPAAQVKASAIYDDTGAMVGFKDNSEGLRRVEALLEENNRHQRNIDNNTQRTANKSDVIEMNGKVVAREIASDVNTEIKREEQRKVRFKGGTRT